MSYTIEPVDIRNPKIEEQLIRLFKDAFKTNDSLPRGYLYNNTYTKKASAETIFLAAIENDEIIGCSGFLATNFIYNDKSLNCYQAVWAATHPDHQGKRIFININNEGKKILKAKEAGFIYALAGESSHHIFMNKLGFKEIPSVMVKIPNIPFLRDGFLHNNNNKNIEYYKSSTFYPPEEQIIDLKKNTGDGMVIEVKEGDSFLWGKLKTNYKFGISFKYFYIGGIHLNNIHDLKGLLNQVYSKYHVHYIQIVSCKSNRYNELIKNWKPAKMNGFIFFELSSGPIDNVNIFYGAIDVF